MPAIKFANTVVEVESQVVAKVTAFNRNISVSEENITGSEDVVVGQDVLQSEFASIAVEETATIEGVAIEDSGTGLDVGQSELRDAAETGATVTVTHTRSTGYGWSLSGFFTAYAETGSTAGVYRFSGTFRVNSKTEIVPGS